MISSILFSMNNYIIIILVFILSATKVFSSEVPHVYIDPSIGSFPTVDVDDEDVLHIFSHGRSGELLLEGEWLVVEQIAEFILGMTAIDRYRHINIYGCEFAKGHKGYQAVKKLEELLQKSVSASDDITGIDGDWHLEVGPTISPFMIHDFKGNLQFGPTDDFDGDGIANQNDSDDDNDGVLDSEETTCAQDSISNSGVTATTEIGHSGDPAVLVNGVQTEATFILNTEDITGKEVLKFELDTPQNLSSIEIGVTASTVSFFFAGAEVKVQGSHDDINWIDLTNTLTMDGTADELVDHNNGGAELFELARVSDYKYYRILGVSGLSRNAVFLEEAYFRGGSCTDINTDGDALSNRFDTDSDDDGCSDAYEAGATKNITPDYTFPTANGGVNGFDDDLETNPESNIYLGAYTYNNVTDGVCSLMSACTDPTMIDPFCDYDGDGFLNKDDADDDNDGILDIIECPKAALVANGHFDTDASQWEGGPNYTSSTNSPFRHGAYYTTIGEDDSIGAGSLQQANNVASSGISQVFQSVLNPEVDYFYTFDLGIWTDFVEPDSDAIYSIEIRDASNNELSPPIILETGNFYTDIENHPASKPGLGSNKTTFRSFNGSFTVPTAGDYSIFIKSAGNGNQPYDYFIDRVAVDGEECTADSDLDGLTNKFDLDSDNDDCSDFIEGGGNFTASNGVPAGGSASGGTGSSVTTNMCADFTCVDNLGIPIPTTGSTPQGIGTSQDNVASDPNCCPVTETPMIDGTMATAFCDQAIVDVTGFISNSDPNGRLAVFTTDMPSGIGEEIDGTMAPNSGTYYFFFYNASEDCFGPVSVPLSITNEISPNAGTDVVKTGCSVAANGITTFDLDDELMGEDTGGTWTAGSGPNVGAGNVVDFTGSPDGAYVYTYTVTGSSPCVDDQSTVTFNITTCACPDADNDGTCDANELPGEENDPCKPDPMAIPSGDCDGDGTPNGSDPNPTDPCVDDGTTGDEDTSNAVWQAADCDGDGTPNGSDPEPFNPCVPTNSNCPPTANNDGGTTDPSTPVIINITMNDMDQDGTIDDSSLDLDPNMPGQQNSFMVADEGTFVDNGNGTVTFTPIPSFVDGISTIPYTVNDNNGNVSNEATISVVVPNCTADLTDTDGDGLTDCEELTGIDNPMTPTAPTDTSDPNDPCNFTGNPIPVTSNVIWQAADCDGDGTPNGSDSQPFDPCVGGTPGNEDLMNPLWADEDCDGDGTPNGKEVDPDGDGTPGGTGPNGEMPTSPYDPCQDDGNRGDEDQNNPLWQAADCDGDGITNGSEVDPDGNGIPGGTGPNGEMPTNPYDPCDPIVADGDLSNPLWADADCDGDGIPNGREVDPDGDGTPGGTGPNGEMPTNPYDPCDPMVADGDLSNPVWADADCDGDGTPNGSDSQPFDPCVGGTPGNEDLMNPLWADEDCDGDGTPNGSDPEPFNPCVPTNSNCPPTANNDGGTTNPSTPVIIDITMNDMDQDGTIDDSSLDLDPSMPGQQNSFMVADEGTFVDNGNGTVTFTPVPSFVDGISVISYTVNDNFGNPSNEATITVVVPNCTADLTDTDGDGLTDCEEYTGIDNPMTPTAPTDTSDPNDPCNFTGNPTPVTSNVIWQAADCDGDGTPNGSDSQPFDPCVGGTPGNEDLMNPLWADEDCDGDGTPNGKEVDPDGDGTPGGTGPNGEMPTSPYDPCQDDGNRGDEDQNNPLWQAADCDGDGITNGSEVDPDGNGIPGGTGPNGEMPTNPYDPCDPIVADGDLSNPLWADADCDGDGIPNGREVDPDGDGIPGGTGPNGEMPSDPTNSCDPILVIINSAVSQAELKKVLKEIMPTGDLSNPLWADADCDGDGIPNGREVDPDGDGTPGGTGPNGEMPTNPYDSCDPMVADGDLSNPVWADADCDGDGNPNGNEIDQGGNPISPDASDDTGAAIPGITTMISILDNDNYLANNDPNKVGNTTITQVGGTAEGTVSFDPDTGIMNYTPTAGEEGKTVTVVYEVCNTNGNTIQCTRATVSVRVVKDISSCNCSETILKTNTKDVKISAPAQIRYPYFMCLENGCQQVWSKRQRAGMHKTIEECQKQCKR